VLPSNAYQRLLYRHLSAFGIELVPSERLRVGWLRRARSDVGILHFHWPQPYYAYTRGPHVVRSALTAVRLALFAGRLAAARGLGYRIVWTIHQVLPHESATPRLDWVAALALSRAAHVLVAHDRATAERARRQLRLARGRVQIVPHGSYRGEYPVGRARLEVRAELGIAPDAFVFLTFGLVRRYKDIEAVLDAFSAFSEPGAALVVAGLPVDEDVAATVGGAAAADPRIVPLLRFIPDEQVAELYAASDAAVVARADGGTSGALVLALSLGVPVVAARTETYADLTGDGAAAWLFEPGVPGELRAALAEAAGDRDRAHEKAAAAFRLASELEWPAIAERLAGLMLGGATG
jgi:beta-1,4-mannosyltransferase